MHAHPWLAARGYRYVSFPGPMSVEFKSYREAVELAEIFYPRAAGAVRRRGERKVPFEVLGINPPRDLAFRVLCGPAGTTRPASPRARSDRNACEPPRCGSRIAVTSGAMIAILIPLAP